MSDRIEKIREKAETRLRDIWDDSLDVGSVLDGAFRLGATEALTYTDEDVERAARVLLDERASLWGGIPDDGIWLRRYLAAKALESFGARRAE